MHFCFPVSKHFGLVHGILLYKDILFVRLTSNSQSGAILTALELGPNLKVVSVDAEHKVSMIPKVELLQWSDIRLSAR
jgi:hypothetical protein